jgi:hypothetical protein
MKTILFSGLLLCSAFTLARANASSLLYDKPLHETHTTLPSDPDNRQLKPKLSCFYYPDFMVKQVDLGEQGAEQISILHRAKDQEEPQCLRANVKDEIVIDPRAWSGYFEGVKGYFIFLSADDGYFHGLSFGVFSASDGRKIFEDDQKIDKGAITFTIIEALNDLNNETDSSIMLRYGRVYVALCSLRTNEKSCWSSIKRITGLTETVPPDCKTDYEAEKKAYPDNVKEIDSFPSVITYDVEVVLSPRNTALRVIPISKVMECYPGDF